MVYLPGHVHEQGEDEADLEQDGEAPGGRRPREIAQTAQRGRQPFHDARLSSRLRRTASSMGLNGLVR